MRQLFIESLCIFLGLCSEPTTGEDSSPSLSLLWSDEFDGSALDSTVWNYEEGTWGDGELQEYTRSNIGIENGNLVIRVQDEYDQSGIRTNVTSGRINTAQKVEFTYGTIEARIQMPNPTNGLWPCFWMLGASFPEVGWPKSGSFTISQIGSVDANAQGQGATHVNSAAHWREDGLAAYDGDVLETPFDLSTDFHTYHLEWTPTYLATYVDGIPIFLKDISVDGCSYCDEFHFPFYFILNVAVGGFYPQVFELQDVTAPLPAEFLVDYIRIYDNGFTELSGAGTTDATTASPTSIAPTTTLSPTVTVPTMSPSLWPSTDSNSESPTETTAPTVIPSVATEAPTASPSVAPTTAPTVAPSAFPSKTSPAPSQVSSGKVVQRFAAVGILMRLRNAQPLSPAMERKWADATSLYLSNEIKEMIGRVDVESVTISVALVSQEPPYNGRRLAVRELQADQELTFNAVLAIISEIEINDVNPYIVGAFDSERKRESYVQQLQSSTNGFGNAIVESVAPAESVARVQGQETDTSTNTGADVGMIVGLVVAALVVGLAGFMVCKRCKKGSCPSCQCRPFRFHRLKGRFQRKDSISAYDPETNEDDSLYTTHTNKSAIRPPSIRSDSLYTGSQTSSLPTPGDTLQRTSDGESHSDQTYDYECAFKNDAGSIADSQSASQCYPETVSSGKTPFTEFEVKVPSGKVGLVLETAMTGDPFVHEIKPFSPMEGQVQVGDRLLRVDGQDVTMVHAETVSRIIASKKYNPVRRFTFARPNTTSNAAAIITP